MGVLLCEDVYVHFVFHHLEYSKHSLYSYKLLYYVISESDINFTALVLFL